MPKLLCHRRLVKLMANLKSSQPNKGSESEGGLGCSRCRWLYSLASECMIITLIIVHILATTIEILVHADLIHVPHEDSSSGLAITKAPPSENTTSDGIFDPGGDTCNPMPKDEQMVVTVEVMRYTTLAISALFLIEMIVKITQRGKGFLRDPWQAFDLLVVVVSLAVEIAYFVEHDPLVCFHPATELAGYIVVFRFWRIPRVCNIKKKRYARKVDNDLVFLRKTKIDIDRKYENLETLYKKQVMSLEKLYTMCWEHSEIQIEVEKILKEDEPGSVPNGNGPRKSFGNAIDHALKHEETSKVAEQIINKNLVNGYIPGTDSKYIVHESPIKTSPIPNGHTKKGSNREKNKKTKSKIESDSNHNSVDEGETENFSKLAIGIDKLDSAIDEVFMDSDGSETPIHNVATVQEVKVQIEEVTRQNQLPSITKAIEDDDTDNVVMRRKQEKVAGIVNEGYTEDDQGEGENDQEKEEEVDGSNTYRSADGIPMTDL